jgi:hypothetical protein
MTQMQEILPLRLHLQISFTVPGTTAWEPSIVAGCLAQCQWITSAILATWEAEIRRINV